ncbi:MAG: phasin family protein [Oscillospiraceae bacterium]|nr:phasin family protein [Oscillospiraceae bacterium]
MDENEKNSLEKILLAGVGAIAKTAEAAGEIFEDLVKKGTLTVEQGKLLNEELKYKAKEKVTEAKQKVQSTAVSGIVNNVHKLTPEERAEIRARMDELDSEDENNKNDSDSSNSSNTNSSSKTGSNSNKSDSSGKIDNMNSELTINKE